MIKETSQGHGAFPISLLRGGFACYPSAKDCFTTVSDNSEDKRSWKPSCSRQRWRPSPSRRAALRADEGEQRCFSPRLQAQGGALQVSFCIELRCPGVNVCVGTSENGREKTRLTMCTWCTCRWYITGCAVRGSAGMMLSCKRGYMGPMFSVVPPTQV